MAYCSSTFEGLPLASGDSRSLRLFTLPQWHIFMCRARWMVTPHPSDEGSMPADGPGERWMGATKTLFWLAAAIGIGILIAGLGAG